MQPACEVRRPHDPHAAAIESLVGGVDSVPRRPTQAFFRAHHVQSRLQHVCDKRPLVPHGDRSGKRGRLARARVEDTAHPLAVHALVPFRAAGRERSAEDLHVRYGSLTIDRMSEFDGPWLTARQ